MYDKSYDLILLPVHKLSFFHFKEAKKIEKPAAIVRGIILLHFDYLPTNYIMTNGTN